MIEVLKQMVEALETAWTYDEDNADGYYFEAIKAGKQAISELEQRSIAELESQEPVAWDLADKVRQDLDRKSCPDAFMRIAVESIVKHHPPQRTWVGLTDEEAQWLYDNCRTPSNLIDMVEAKLKEKNT
jgi:hypothetical protein